MKSKIYSAVLFLTPPKFRPFIGKLKLGYQLVFSKYSYLVQIGYVNSKVSNSLVDEDGDHMPWMNYPFIDFLNEKLQKDSVVFEYGSGFSTVFFAKRTKKVISIEYDKKWYEKTKNTLLNAIDNAAVHYAELNDDYPYAIEKHLKNEKCDIVVIDGRKRVKSAIASYNYLSEKGVVIFDDSWREYYDEGINFYLEKGFKKITFKGIKPTGFVTDQTTLLYRSGANCLGI